jgi:predicted kinase
VVRSNIEHLVVVYGMPGAGKTWLAEQLAPLVGYPLLSRDRILASLFEELAVPDGMTPLQWSQSLGTATFAVFLELAGWLGPRLILDAHFQARFGGDADILALSSAPTEIYLHAPPEVILERHLARFDQRRSAHRVHRRPTLEDITNALPFFEPLDLPGPRLSIDTSNLVDVPAVADWIQAQSPSGA